MKATKLLTILLSILLVNCSKNEKETNYIIFCGIVKNPMIDSLQIFDNNYTPLKTIHLSKDNTFKDTLNLPEGYYYLGDFKTSTKLLFLKPSFNINANIIANDEDYSISFQGNGGNENNYLQQKKIFNKSFKKVKKYEYFLNLNEPDFLKLSDSINSLKIHFLKTQKNLDNKFLDYELFSLENEKVAFLDNFRIWKGNFIKDENFKVSENYPNPLSDFDISDEKMLVHPSYLNYIKTILKNNHNIISKDFSINFDYLKVLKADIKSQKIKDELAFRHVNRRIENDQKLTDSVFDIYMSIVKNEDYRIQVNEFYNNSQKISKGKVSPSFEFFDINNKLITLESLKGKLVYIDIWATWCIPCIQEIPSLNELEEEFKNKDIYFVSMCLKDSKDSFKKMVMEKDLGGIQLFAPDPTNSFFQKYYVTGIPRFILIDKNGKIIESYAYKPSNPKLKEQLKEYLKIES